jgi:hypothetical protein
MRQILPRNKWHRSWRTLGRGARVSGRGSVVEAKPAYWRRGGGAVARAQRARSGGGGHARRFSSSANPAWLRCTLISKDGGYTYTVLDVEMHQQEYFLWPMTEHSFEVVASLVSGGVTPRPEADLRHLVVQPMRSAHAYSMRNLVASDATSPVRATPRSHAKSESRFQFPMLAFQSYTTRAPEALDSLGPEERRTVYSMLGLRVDALPDKSLRVQDAFGEESLVCHHDRTSTR